MRFALLILLGNAAFLSFSQGNDIVDRLWGNRAKPELTRLEYTVNDGRESEYVENEGEIKIDCGAGVKIILHQNENYSNNLIEITRDGELLYDFFSRYGIFHFYLSGVYQIQLFAGAHTVLLVSYPVGATGLSANTTWGILFDIDNRVYQYLWTWGMVDEHFVDIDGDGVFEFVSVDYQGINSEPKLVANVFRPDTSGQYAVNTSMEENNTFVLYFESLRVENLDWRQSEIELTIYPDASSGTSNGRYYPK
ncbi:MAG: hypothetical protein LBQ89_00980 [Treponema sp.]|jgi:hypothetical protein|nr:hypothetical protein [Treponema sp.]